MALISCKDCEKEFSTDAKRCPHCGANKPQGFMHNLCWFLVLSFGAIMIIGAFSGVFGDHDVPITKSANNQVKLSLNFTRPIYTENYGIICPLSLMLDRRADHSPSAVISMFTSAFSRSEKAKALGCEELQGGIRVYVAAPDSSSELLHLSFSPNELPMFFTLPSQLSNNIGTP